MNLKWSAILSMLLKVRINKGDSLNLLPLNSKVRIISEQSGSLSMNLLLTIKLIFQIPYWLNLKSSLLMLLIKVNIRINILHHSLISPLILLQLPKTTK